MGILCFVICFLIVFQLAESRYFGKFDRDAATPFVGKEQNQKISGNLKKFLQNVQDLSQYFVDLDKQGLEANAMVESNNPNSYASIFNKKDTASNVETINNDKIADVNAFQNNKISINSLANQNQENFNSVFSLTTSIPDTNLIMMPEINNDLIGTTLAPKNFQPKVLANTKDTATQFINNNNNKKFNNVFDLNRNLDNEFEQYVDPQASLKRMPRVKSPQQHTENQQRFDYYEDMYSDRTREKRSAKDSGIKAQINGKSGIQNVPNGIRGKSDKVYFGEKDGNVINGPGRGQDPKESKNLKHETAQKRDVYDINNFLTEATVDPVLLNKISESAQRLVNGYRERLNTARKISGNQLLPPQATLSQGRPVIADTAVTPSARQIRGVKETTTDSKNNSTTELYDDDYSNDDDEHFQADILLNRPVIADTAVAPSARRIRGVKETTTDSKNNSTTEPNDDDYSNDDDEHFQADILLDAPAIRKRTVSANDMMMEKIRIMGHNKILRGLGNRQIGKRSDSGSARSKRGNRLTRSFLCKPKCKKTTKDKCTKKSTTPCTTKTTTCKTTTCKTTTCKTTTTCRTTTPSCQTSTVDPCDSISTLDQCDMDDLVKKISEFLRNALANNEDLSKICQGCTAGEKNVIDHLLDNKALINALQHKSECKGGNCLHSLIKNSLTELVYDGTVSLKDLRRVNFNGDDTADVGAMEGGVRGNEQLVEQRPLNDEANNKDSLPNTFYIIMTEQSKTVVSTTSVYEYYGTKKTSKGGRIFQNKFIPRKKVEKDIDSELVGELNYQDIFGPNVPESFRTTDQFPCRAQFSKNGIKCSIHDYENEYRSTTPMRPLNSATQFAEKSDKSNLNIPLKEYFFKGKPPESHPLEINKTKGNSKIAQKPDPEFVDKDKTKNKISATSKNKENKPSKENNNDYSDYFNEPPIDKKKSKFQKNKMHGHRENYLFKPQQLKHPRNVGSTPNPKSAAQTNSKKAQIDSMIDQLNNEDLRLFQAPHKENTNNQEKVKDDDPIKTKNSQNHQKTVADKNKSEFNVKIDPVLKATTQKAHHNKRSNILNRQKPHLDRSKPPKETYDEKLADQTIEYDYPNVLYDLRDEPYDDESSYGNNVVKNRKLLSIDGDDDSQNETDTETFTPYSSDNGTNLNGDDNQNDTTRAKRNFENFFKLFKDDEHYSDESNYPSQYEEDPNFFNNKDQELNFVKQSDEDEYDQDAMAYSDNDGDVDKNQQKCHGHECSKKNGEYQKTLHDSKMEICQRTGLKYDDHLDRCVHPDKQSESVSTQPLSLSDANQIDSVKQDNNTAQVNEVKHIPTNMDTESENIVSHSNENNQNQETVVKRSLNEIAPNEDSGKTAVENVEENNIIKPRSVSASNKTASQPEYQEKGANQSHTKNFTSKFCNFFKNPFKKRPKPPPPVIANEAPSLIANEAPPKETNPKESNSSLTNEVKCENSSDTNRPHPNIKIMNSPMYVVQIKKIEPKSCDNSSKNQLPDANQPDKFVDVHHPTASYRKYSTKTILKAVLKRDEMISQMANVPQKDTKLSAQDAESSLTQMESLLPKSNDAIGYNLLNPSAESNAEAQKINENSNSIQNEPYFLPSHQQKKRELNRRHPIKRFKRNRGSHYKPRFRRFERSYNSYAIPLDNLEKSNDKISDDNTNVLKNILSRNLREGRSDYVSAMADEPEIPINLAYQANRPAPSTLVRQHREMSMEKESNNNNDLQQAVIGDLANNIVNSIFKSIQESKKLSRTIGQGLYRPRTPVNNANISSDTIANAQISEDMLQEVVVILNQIISRQIKLRSCPQLCSDWLKFLRWLLSLTGCGGNSKTPEILDDFIRLTTYSHETTEAEQQATKYQILFASPEIDTGAKKAMNTNPCDSTIARKIQESLNIYNQLSSEEQQKARKFYVYLQLQLKDLEGNCHNDKVITASTEIWIDTRKSNGNKKQHSEFSPVNKYDKLKPNQHGKSESNLNSRLEPKPMINQYGQPELDSFEKSNPYQPGPLEFNQYNPSPPYENGKGAYQYNQPNGRRNSNSNEKFTNNNNDENSHPKDTGGLFRFFRRKHHNKVNANTQDSPDSHNGEQRVGQVNNNKMPDTDTNNKHNNDYNLNEFDPNMNFDDRSPTRQYLKLKNAIDSVRQRRRRQYYNNNYQSKNNQVNRG